ncbi:hypothetical protein GO730_15240 [Spirosoma sp. HMF3257]|uniref:DUF5666 domain-containing protein n=1 Tax=Spirosoma telluris TaxID=2183553 RepID=A0A327NJ38_9BACT|nr:hypothetical protein [Spirosoma telluris]RAI75202.1 hypothetical protein HMF3257_15185 [Spirosoma telluris]
METNAKVIALAILTATLASPFVYAQQPTGPGDPVLGVAMNAPDSEFPGRPQPGGPGPRHGKHGGRPDGPGKPHGPQDAYHQGLTSLTTVSGTVGQWTGNDDAILDGFMLNAGSGATTVKFPPHLGQQVQKAIKSGSNVSVTGYSDTNPKGETFFRMNSLTAGKITVLDTPPTPPATMPAPPEQTTVTGKIADYRLDREARVNGLILDDKTIVTIPAHVASQLANLAKKGSTITVQGYPKSLRDGQVQLEKVNVLRASVLTINGQQYLVR